MTRIAVLISVLVASATATPLHAGGGVPPGDDPAFAVTSVRLNTSGGERGGAIQPGRFAQTNVTLEQLIRMAYPVDQISGGPSWLDSDRFDIEGKGDFGLADYVPKADGSAPPVYLMLRRLLEERFQLQVHTEQQQRPAFALVLANGGGQLGPRLQRSDVDCDAVTREIQRTGQPAARPRGNAGTPLCSRGGGPGHLVGNSLDMPQLASALSQSAQRTVVDRTGLTGRFNLELEWTPDPVAAPLDTPATNGPDLPPPLVTALREQLGLKLEPTKAPVAVLVIDRANRPTPN